MLGAFLRVTTIPKIVILGIVMTRTQKQDSAPCFSKPFMYLLILFNKSAVYKTDTVR